MPEGTENNTVNAEMPQTPPPLTEANIQWMKAQEDSAVRTQMIRDAREGAGSFTVDPERRYGGAPDRKDGMAETAALEAQQQMEIERISQEAAMISPEFGQSMETELVNTQRETLKVKIENKIYDLLTAVEKKIGQGIVTREIKKSLREAKSFGGDLRAEAKLGFSNLRKGIQGAAFIPGDASSSPFVGSEVNLRNPDDRVSALVYGGGIAIEDSGLVRGLERMRAGIRERKNASEEIAGLVGGYIPVRVGA